MAYNLKTILRLQQDISYLYFLENLTCLIWSTEFQNLICRFSCKLHIRLGISSERDFLWDFQFLMAENTTRKDLFYSSQTQKFQRRAKLNKWIAPSTLRHTEVFFFLGLLLMWPDLPFCFSHNTRTDKLPFLSSSDRFLIWRNEISLCWTYCVLLELMLQESSMQPTVS